MVDRHHPGKAPTALLQMLADGSWGAPGPAGWK